MRPWERLELENVVDQIELETLVHASIERVWEMLTKQEHVAQWYAFGGAEIDLRLGGRLVFRWDEHGEFFGQVERVQPPNQFVFRFAGHDAGEMPRPDNSTLVTFTLEQKGSETRIRVVESGFSELANPGEGDIAKAEISLQGWRNGMSALASMARCR
jgi:uncharacterized protein YndB with AHSA1/START domain